MSMARNLSKGMTSLSNTAASLPRQQGEREVLIYPKKLPDLQTVFPWGAAVALPENAVKVAQIFVAHGVGNVVHVPVRVPQQKRRLGQPFFLNQLGIGLAGLSTDLPG